MNNGKIWLVVNPTVGIPIFLGAVAVGSFSVHLAVLSNTTWVADFLQGKPIGGSGFSALESTVDTADAATVTPSPVAFDLKDGTTVTLPDGRKARLVVEDPSPTVAQVARSPGVD